MKCALYKLTSKEFELIPFFKEDFFVCLEAEATHFALEYFFGFLLLALNTRDFDFCDLFSIMFNACKNISDNLTLCHLTTGNNGIFQRTENTFNGQLADFGLDNFWRKEVFHRCFGVIEEFINNFKQPHLYFIAHREALNGWRQLDIEAINDRFIVCSEADVVFGNISYATSHNTKCYFAMSFKELEAIDDRGERALNIRFYDNIEFFCVMLLVNHFEKIGAGDIGAGTFSFAFLTSMISLLASFFFVFDDSKRIAKLR